MNQQDINQIQDDKQLGITLRREHFSDLFEENESQQLFFSYRMLKEEFQKQHNIDLDNFDDVKNKILQRLKNGQVIFKGGKQNTKKNEEEEEQEEEKKQLNDDNDNNNKQKNTYENIPSLSTLGSQIFLLNKPQRYSSNQIVCPEQQLNSFRKESSNEDFDGKRDDNAQNELDVDEMDKMDKKDQDIILDQANYCKQRLNQMMNMVTRIGQIEQAFNNLSEAVKYNYTWILPKKNRSKQNIDFLQMFYHINIKENSIEIIDCKFQDQSELYSFLEKSLQSFTSMEEYIEEFTGLVSPFNQHIHSVVQQQEMHTLLNTSPPPKNILKNQIKINSDNTYTSAPMNYLTPFELILQLFVIVLVTFQFLELYWHIAAGLIVVCQAYIIMERRQKNKRQPYVPYALHLIVLFTFIITSLLVNNLDAPPQIMLTSYNDTSKIQRLWMKHTYNPALFYSLSFLFICLVRMILFSFNVSVLL